MAWRIDTVFVWVTDLPRSLEWHGQFGIESGAGYGTWQTMLVDGGTRFALHEGDHPTGGATASVTFGVGNLDEEIELSAKLGIHPSDTVVTNTGVSRFATLADPDGNEVQLLKRA